MANYPYEFAIKGEEAHLHIVAHDTDWQDWKVEVIFYLPIGDEYENAEQEAQAIFKKFMEQNPQFACAAISIDRAPIAF